MKLQRLLDEGTWVAKSKDGVTRRFRSEQEATNWTNSYVKPPVEPKAPKAPRLKREDVLRDLFYQFEIRVGNAFPDGDPVSDMLPYLSKRGLTINDLDAAVKRFSRSKDLYDYMANMWDDYARDTVAGMESSGHFDEHSWAFRPNPWR